MNALLVSHCVASFVVSLLCCSNRLFHFRQQIMQLLRRSTERHDAITPPTITRRHPYSRRVEVQEDYGLSYLFGQVGAQVVVELVGCSGEMRYSCREGRE